MPATTSDPIALAALLNRGDDGYYSDGTSPLTDAQYDSAKDQLEALVEQNPGLADHAEIARALRHVGRSTTAVPTAAGEVRHQERMLSLDKATTDEQVEAFLHRVGGDGLLAPTFTVAPKYDGVAVSLLFRDGHLVQAASRGDSRVGEDLTAHARLLADLPTTIDAEGEVEVRGEAIIPRSQWNAVQRDRAARGLEPLTAARNACAGALRHSDPAEVTARRVAFRAYSVHRTDHRTHSDAIRWLRDHGFLTHAITDVARHDVLDAAHTIAAQRDQADEERDGVVITVDPYEVRERLGEGSRTPRWAIALKPASEETVSTLRGVTYEVGKSGRIAPKAHFDPVIINGVTVSKATLNNRRHTAEISAANDPHQLGDGLRIGDVIVISRRNDVIPKVEGIVDDGALRTGTETAIDWPTTCPVCDDTLDTQESREDRCVNEVCQSRVVARTIDMVGRDYLDADGIGAALVEAAFDAELITQPGELLLLGRDDFLRLDAVEETSANNAARAITQAVTNANTEPHRVIASLGIRMVGRSLSRQLIARYGTVNEVLAHAHDDDIVSIELMGPERVRRFRDGLASPTVQATLAAYQQAGINFDARPAGWGEQGDTPQPLAGITVVLTGALTMHGEKASRGAIKTALEDAGAKVASSVSATCTVILTDTPDSGTSKLAKGRQLGIPVEGQDVLDALLDGHVPDHLCPQEP